MDRIEKAAAKLQLTLPSGFGRITVNNTVEAVSTAEAGEVNETLVCGKGVDVSEGDVSGERVALDVAIPVEDGKGLNKDDTGQSAASSDFC